MSIFTHRNGFLLSSAPSERFFAGFASFAINALDGISGKTRRHHRGGFLRGYSGSSASANGIAAGVATTLGSVRVDGTRLAPLPALPRP